MSCLVLVLLSGLVTTAAEDAASSRSTDLPAVAVLCEPSLPVQGAAADVRAIERILQAVPCNVQRLSASQFADPQTFSAAQYALVILPYGRSFPAQARDNFISFLRKGGDFISLGGYAFQQLLVQTPQGWASEDDWLGVQRERALDRERSLIRNGGFESDESLPVSGVAVDGHWRRSDDAATIVADFPFEASRCARVQAAPGGPLTSPTIYLDLAAEPGETFEIRACLKTRDVMGEGYAYTAVYQHAADERIVAFRDFATCRGTQDWAEHRYTFQPTAEVTRVRVQLGLFRGREPRGSMTSAWAGLRDYRPSA